MTKLVVLDAFTLTANEPSRVVDGDEPRWDRLAELVQVQAYARSAPGQIVERAREAQLVLTNKAPLDAATIGQLPQLRYIGVLATGYNIVDVASARARGIVVTNVPGYSTESVAQLVFGLLLELASGVGAHDRAVHDGRWATGPDFSFTLRPLIELSGKTLGIVGLGAIGQRVATIAHALGMRVIVHSRSQKPTDVPVRWVGLDELLSQSDAVTLHCPLTDATRGLINAQRLAGMKRSAYLINTGRGPLVDESALASALNEGRIAGAGLDVLSVEPPPPGNPLLTARNCVITPHVAWASREARHRLMQIATDNVAAFLRGQPTNVVG